MITNFSLYIKFLQNFYKIFDKQHVARLHPKFSRLSANQIADDKVTTSWKMADTIRTFSVLCSCGKLFIKLMYNLRNNHAMLMSMFCLICSKVIINFA